MHGEGISTPRTRHKGRQPLIKCVKQDFKIMYFSFLYSLCIFPFLCLLYFFGSRQGYCPCSYVSLGVMRNSDLRCSLSLKVCVLH